MKKEEIRRYPKYVLTTLPGCSFLFRDQRTEEIFVYLCKGYVSLPEENSSLKKKGVCLSPHLKGLHISNDSNTTSKMTVILRSDTGPNCLCH